MPPSVLIPVHSWLSPYLCFSSFSVFDFIPSALFHSSLCPYFVCPANISDSMLEYAASLHLHSRLPVQLSVNPYNKFVMYIHVTV